MSWGRVACGNEGLQIRNVQPNDVNVYHVWEFGKLFERLHYPLLEALHIGVIFKVYNQVARRQVAGTNRGKLGFRFEDNGYVCIRKVARSEGRMTLD
jgi:hypothetical protein